ncbi:hypothetical protein [Nonomuraea bangladeshensis]|uniref:hypothetical protein n=1 Tax=Nonomuraea bangladeshensis TaxID=404385 RepID=UPI0031E35486
MALLLTLSGITPGQLRGNLHLPYAHAVTAHSLRAGGVPVAVIAKHGRWAPASPVVLRYIRAVDRWRDNAMPNVGL